MIPLPVQRGRANPLEGGAEAISMASRLELRRYRDVPRFLLAALRLRQQFGDARGSVQLRLAARPMRRSFFTASIWKDRAALDDFVQTARHAEVMEQFGPLLTRSDFRTWVIPAHGPLPGLRESLAHLSDTSLDG